MLFYLTTPVAVLNWWLSAPAQDVTVDTPSTAGGSSA